MKTPEKLFISPKLARHGPMVSASAGVEHSITPATPIEALMLAILAEIRGLRDDLAQNVHSSRRRENLSFSVPSRADRALLAKLLPAIGGAFGSEPFLARDLFEHTSLRLVLRGLNTKRIGRLLQRADGQAVDGYVVERGTVELGAILWRVVRVAEFPGEQKPFRSPTPADGSGVMGGRSVPL